MTQQALISRLNELPRIQKVLQELLDLVNQDEVDFGELAEKISSDQVICARLLRMANSAHFGGQKSISSVNDAIIRVGMGAVKTLVVASFLSSAFPKVDTLDMETYWVDTFEVSVIASKIADQNNMDANEVFTTGLLHNIGELMIHTLVPDQAQQIAKRTEMGEDPIAVQEELLDTSAPSLGAMLAKAWKFPLTMVDAIANAHDPRNSEVAPQVATTLHLAKAINKDWDDLSQEKKQAFIANHPDSRLLNLSDSFAAIIDGVRGNGRELAAQLNG
ncbi:HDOD domain-containing protein [Vibrio mexicanus]|uniref:HDOD domain-containing protein n=1 Tax=Vibrio mexicanus TaxID=1004326 RepID=UPI00063CF033|nr:HDOD domain-containing protein [Vibrio mexicanus]